MGVDISGTALSSELLAKDLSILGTVHELWQQDRAFGAEFDRQTGRIGRFGRRERLRQDHLVAHPDGVGACRRGAGVVDGGTRRQRSL